MKWSPDVKRFFIVEAIAVVIIALACIFFWEWDGLLYFIWGVFGVVWAYKRYVERKLFGGW